MSKRLIYQLRPFLAFTWLLLVAKLAHGQTVSIAHGLASIPPANILVAVGLAGVGGLAWTSQKEAKAEGENKKLLLTVVSDLLVSIVAGLSVYFMLTTVTDSIMIQSAGITIAGYGGTRVLEPATQAVIDFVKRVFAGFKAT